MFDYADTQDAILALGKYVPTDIDVATYLCVQPEYEVTPIFSDPDKTLYEGKVTWKTPDIAAGGGGGGGSTNTAKDPQEPEDNTSLTVSFNTMSEVRQFSIGARSRLKIEDGNGGYIWPTEFWGAYAINQQSPMLPPEGIEYNVPIVSITAKTVVSYSVATPEWQRARFGQLWHTNDAEWNGLDRNTTMFTGMELSQRSDDNWDVTYNFEYRTPTKDNPVPFSYYDEGGLKSVEITKANPWMVVDARYEEVKQTSSDGYDKTVRNLTEVICHNIYYQTDFNELGMVGIPTS
tara:strand:+ start:932 stop:1804 length:873 start_codon:yes stop_codon:yes gene_type:complete